MEYGWPKELAEFRQQVRAFVAEAMTPALSAEIRGLGHGGQGGAEIRKVVAEVDRRGWLKKSWPVEHGGAGESPWYRYILAHELRYAGIPFTRGTANMLAPA